MGSTTKTLIGVVGVGFGVLLLYASVKNLKLLGPDGVIVQAMKNNGKIDVTKAFNVNPNVQKGSGNNFGTTTPSGTGTVLA